MGHSRDRPDAIAGTGQMPKGRRKPRKKRAIPRSLVASRSNQGIYLRKTCSVLLKAEAQTDVAVSHANHVISVGRAVPGCRQLCAELSAKGRNGRRLVQATPLLFDSGCPPAPDDRTANATGRRILPAAAGNNTAGAPATGLPDRGKRWSTACPCATRLPVSVNLLHRHGWRRVPITERFPDSERNTM